MNETPTTRAVVRHSDDVETEGWIDENGTRLTWHTLLTGSRDGTRGMSAGITEIAPTKDGITLHRHAIDELYFFVRGHGSVTIDGKAHLVREGSVVFVPSNAWHAVSNDGDEPMQLFYVFPTDSFTDVVYEYPNGSSAPSWTSA